MFYLLSVKAIIASHFEILQIKYTKERVKDRRETKRQYALPISGGNGRRGGNDGYNKMVEAIDYLKVLGLHTSLSKCCNTHSILESPNLTFDISFSYLILFKRVETCHTPKTYPGKERCDNEKGKATINNPCLFYIEKRTCNLF